MFYAALDVSLRSVAICIIDDDGKICLERSVRSDLPDVLLCLAGFGQPIHQVGFEGEQRLHSGALSGDGEANPVGGGVVIADDLMLGCSIAAQSSEIGAIQLRARGVQVTAVPACSLST